MGSSTTDKPEKLLTVPSGATVAPATTSQEYFWAMALDDPEPAAYAQNVAFVVRGPLDASLLDRCISAVVAAHSVFRSILRDDNGKLQMVVLSPSDAPPFELEHGDVSPLPPDEWQQELKRTVDTLAAKGLDLVSGVVVRARLIKLAEETHGLVVAFHHAVTDADSTNRFFKQLFELYAKASTGAPIEAPCPALQYVDVAHAFASWITTETGRARGAFWTNKLRGAPSVLVPNDLPREPVDARRATLRHGIAADPMLPIEYVTIDEQVRDSVIRRARTHRMAIFGVYLAALTWLLERETGQADVSIETTVGMRLEDPTISDVMGSLTAWTILRVDMSGCGSMSDVLPRAGAAIADLKHHGIVHDYYRTVPADLRRVSFNYVSGRWVPASNYGPITIERRAFGFPAWKRPWDLHLTIIDGEKANLAWTANAKLFTRETMQRLLRRYLEVLAT
ncbi:MAG TPA: condensation domain-containing protein [Kofleriaceae bacterium]